MNCPHAKAAQVFGVPDLRSYCRNTVSKLECRFLGKGAQDDFIGLGFLEQEQVERPQRKAKGLARTGPRHDKNRAFDGSNNVLFGIVQLWVCPLQFGRDRHSRPARRKLKTSSAETIIWSRILTCSA